MKKEETDSSSENAIEESAVPAQISAFAAKLGEETGGKFSCYIYRMVRDEETGRTKRPFVKKYVGIEPDPLEIAEKFRCGTYLVQFIWYVKGKQNSRAYTLDVDNDAFPPLVKSNASSLPMLSGGEMSAPMQLQLATIHEISEVMKAAYTSGNGGNIGGGRGGVADPLEQFSGLMETMEGSFARAMAIQSKIMERVYTRNMERQFGLAEEIPQAGGSGPALLDDNGIVGKYAPIVREVVDGIKTVIGFFGSVPPDVVKKIQKDGRFKELLKDQKALVVIGQALRREFGDDKAGELMNTFGVRMVIKQPQAVSKTPDIASLKVQGQAKAPGQVPAPRSVSKVDLKAGKEGKAGK